MNKVWGKRIIIGALVVCLIALGFIRDFVFVNVNYAIGYLNGKAAAYWGHSNMAFLTDYEESTLIISKWVLTVVFTLLFLFFSLFLIRTLYKERSYLKWFALLYAAIVVLAGILFVLGWVTGYSDTGYTLSREFMGFVQSPFPLMLFLPAIYLLKSTRH